QTQTRTAQRGTTRTFYVRVSNDGNAPNNFRVTGRAASTLVVHYYRASMDLTARMLSSTGAKITLEAGHQLRITVRVTIKRSAPIGTMPSTSVTAKWSVDSTHIDLVKARIPITR